MHEEYEEQSIEESNYHLEESAAEDYDALVRAKPELKSLVKQDLNYIGENPETGISLERVDKWNEHVQPDFSAEQLETLKMSRVFTRKEKYSIYWIIKSTGNGDPVSVIWLIDWNSENQDSVSVAMSILEIFDGVKKALSGED